MTHRFNRFVLLMLLGLLFVPIGRAQETAPETLLMTFIPNIQFAPVYVAQGQGYFSDAGFDVSVEYLNEPDVLDLVAAGQNNFGIVSAEQVILAAGQGREVVYVYAWFQQYPVGIVVDAGSEITTIADLRGRRVGLPGRFGASYSGLTTLLSAANLTESDIQLEEIGFNAPEVFCLGAVEAATVYVNNEPLQIRNRAAAGECGAVQDVRVFTVADEVGQLVSNGLITNNALAESNPEKVAGFVGAFDAGLRDTINNPARAYLISKTYVEDLPLSAEFEAKLTELADAQDVFLADNPAREAIAEQRTAMLTALQADFSADELIQFEVLLASIDLWDADQPGLSTSDGWLNVVTTLQTMGMVTGDVDTTSLYTSAFLPVVGDE